VSTLLSNCGLTGCFIADEWLQSKGDVRKEDNVGMVDRGDVPEKPLAIQGSVQLEIPILVSQKRVKCLIKRGFLL
jgi:hypothetical protein